MKIDPLLRALADPTRLRIVRLLAHMELAVGELAQVLGQSQPRVSRHLRLLTEAGLTERLPEGSWVFYRLAHDGGGGRLVEALLHLLPKDEARLDRDHQRLAVVRARRTKAAAAYFRQNASHWDELSSLYIDEAEIERVLLSLLGRSSIDDLLDIGTGTGRILSLLGPRVERGVGIDNSPAMLTIARAKLTLAGLRNCHVRYGDMYDLPWPGGSFDAVTIHHVLHFAERPAIVIAESARMLRAGGRLVIVDFAPHDLEALRSEHAHRRLGFANGEIAGWLVEAGLKPARLRHLRGRALTVSIWSAIRPGPGEARKAPAASDSLETRH